MNKKRKLRLYAFFFFTVFVLGGCDLFEADVSTAHEITFQEKVEINYKEKNVDTCSFVLNVDGHNIKKSAIDSDKRKIYISNYEVSCGSISTQKMGEVTIDYKVEEDIFTLTVEIKDLESPVIELSKETFEITEGETLSIKEHISVKDNVDKADEVKVEIGKFDVNKIGNQEIEIKAIDTSGNSTTTSVKVVVKKKPEEQKPEEQNNSNSSNDGQNSSNQNSTQQNSNQTQQKPSPYIKDFLFVDGYNRITAPQSCQKEMLEAFSKGSSATCNDILDASGDPIGQRLTVY
ncbi:hypothetical protein [Breznakia pachnodae]|uniref:HYR domain-containing protein n=1 Tax=Breznakia pachnodae TaxID=265178 RepID=A0ABU0E3V0_9FIRM|nr:hypothetical protein [Breznakia pachnodae]MDQ0361569.1 hypothetical protein [Breznakia pachnodae]